MVSWWYCHMPEFLFIYLSTCLSVFLCIFCFLWADDTYSIDHMSCINCAVNVSVYLVGFHLCQTNIYATTWMCIYCMCLFAARHLCVFGTFLALFLQFTVINIFNLDSHLGTLKLHLSKILCVVFLHIKSQCIELAFWKKIFFVYCVTDHERLNIWNVTVPCHRKAMTFEMLIYIWNNNCNSILSKYGIEVFVVHYGVDYLHTHTQRKRSRNALAQMIL